MVRLEQEKSWGAILGVLQTDSDKLRMALRRVVGEISMDMSTLEYKLQSDGVNPASDGAYQRYYQLKGLLGGLCVILEGVDGVLSGAIVEMLRDDEG